MKYLLIAFISLQISNSYGAEETGLVGKLRPHVEKYLGTDWGDKIFGKKNVNSENEVAMPAIPKIEENATSTAVYNRKKDSVEMNKEVEQKFNYAYIRELYEATRQNKPNEDEMGKMMNVLSQGGTRDGIYRSLVLDSTYAGMENWERAVKNNSADFAVYFFDKYLGRSIKKKSLEGMSIYTLKRLITERSLEIADAFEQRDELESWYAVMSSDLALKFPLVWQNEVRKNASSGFHKKWASQVPFEHIKSEIIIKLHSSFNSMM